MSPTISSLKLLSILRNADYPQKSIRLLGYGKEGYVFATDDYIFKYIPNGLNLIPDGNLAFLEKTILRNEHIKGIRPLVDIIKQKNDTIFVSPYNEYTPYSGGNPKATLSILADARRNGYVHTNFKPENVMYTTDGRLQLVDIGRDLQPFNKTWHENMILRAYLTTYFPHHPELKNFLSLSRIPPVSEQCTFPDYVSKLENQIIGDEI